VLAEPDPARRLRGAASWLRTLYAAGFDVVMIFEAATDESAETRALLQSKLAGRNQATCWNATRWAPRAGTGDAGAGRALSVDGKRLLGCRTAVRLRRSHRRFHGAG
jgi:hypothetical protein